MTILQSTESTEDRIVTHSRGGALACGAAALVAGLVYVNALRNPFVYDDYHTVVENRSIEHVSDLRAIVLHDVTRPLVNISYAIDRALRGATPIGFHVTNVLLHMLNVMLLFTLSRRLTDDRDRGVLVAFAAAVLFATHPMMTEAVGYITGRSSARPSQPDSFGWRSSRASNHPGGPWCIGRTRSWPSTSWSAMSCC